MNERIRELAEQANKKIRYKIDTHSFKHIDDPDGAYTRVEFDKEKFAELIVKECEKVAKGGSWYYDAPSCGWRQPINFVCNEMKQHFGVEE